MEFVGEGLLGDLSIVPISELENYSVSLKPVESQQSEETLAGENF
jgi:hypothetical protein